MNVIHIIKVNILSSLRTMENSWEMIDLKDGWGLNSLYMLYLREIFECFFRWFNANLNQITLKIKNNLYFCTNMLSFDTFFIYIRWRVFYLYVIFISVLIGRNDSFNKLSAEYSSYRFEKPFSLRKENSDMKKYLILNPRKEIPIKIYLLLYLFIYTNKRKLPTVCVCQCLCDG